MQNNADAILGWRELQAHLSRWYSQPDFHAIEIVLCAYAAHWFLDDDPVWLFVIGPPRTGKSIVVNMLATLDKTHVLSDISENTFLSGFGKGDKRYSLLHRIAPESDPHAVIVFKDFTTFVSKRPDTRKEIVAQLREIHDGHLHPQRGSTKYNIGWEGKITIVAAGTPEVETYWQTIRSLGDRFLQVRWPRGDGIEMGGMAIRQIGSESYIKEELERLSRALFAPDTLKRPNPPAKEEIDKVKRLAEIVTMLRQTVKRHYRTGKITELVEAEGTGALAKGLMQLAMGRAALFRRKQTTTQDVERMHRAMLGAVPAARMQIIAAVDAARAARGDDPGWQDVFLLSGLLKSGFQYHLDELVAIEALERVESEGGGEVRVRFARRFDRLRQASGAQFVVTPGILNLKG